MRYCKHCGDGFTEGRSHKVFCNRLCKKRFRYTPWRVAKGPICELCGFVPVHPCQLDVDHIDGDKSNNDPANYQTLCANCHRLKTWQANEWTKRRAPV
jgi:hypothetical protein